LSRERASALARALRVTALAAFLGLAGGYAVFHAVYPNLGFPPLGEASPVLLLAVLAGPALLAGFATRRIEEVVVQAFVSLPLTVLVASLLSISPVFTRLVQAEVDLLVYDLIRTGFAVLVLSLLVNVVGGFAGAMLRDRILRFVRSPAAPLR